MVLPWCFHGVSVAGPWWVPWCLEGAVVGPWWARGVQTMYVACVGIYGAHGKSDTRARE